MAPLVPSSSYAPETYKYLKENEKQILNEIDENLYSRQAYSEGGKGGGEGTLPFPNLNRFIFPQRKKRVFSDAML